MTFQKYKFLPYSKKYPALFQKEKAKLLKVLPKSIKIEHVGSTAVPGLGGKGIMDIAILTPRAKLKKFTSQLEKLGYEYRPHPGDDKRKFFQKIINYKGKERRVHVHLTLGKDFWNSFITFRDYLKTHDKEREAYAKIKAEAIKHAAGDGKKYREHKQALIQEIAKKAMETDRNP